jgi:hypothetical protein
VLVTAMLLSVGLALGIVGYLALSNTALRLAHRTLFLNDAFNLAEAGVEDALNCFNQGNAGVPLTTAWAGWTLKGANAMRTLPPFNRDQNAIGTVKVFVLGYDSSQASPFIISQATITPFDGSPPIVRVLRIGLRQAGIFINGVAGLNGLSLKGQPVIDSFNSNPSNSPTGPWIPYSSVIARSNASVIVTSGAIELGKGLVKGNVSVGPGVAPPPASQVTGTILTNYAGRFQMPPYPTPASVSQSYNLGNKLPAQLPATGDKPAADGRHYYFVNGATLGNLAIAPGANVTIVGTSTSLSSGLNIGSKATCSIHIDGPISASSQGSLNNSNWAGALQIYTTSSAACEISGNGELRASVYAPNAALKASGGGSSGSVVGSYVARTILATGQMSFHYDEALKYLNTAGGNRWGISSWEEVRLDSDRAALGSLTDSFLP